MNRMAALTAMLLPFTLNAVPNDVKPDDDWSMMLDYNCGDHMTWDFDLDSRTLTITGYGAMWDFSSDAYTADWELYSSSVSHIVFDDRIDYIGENAFEWFTLLETVELPDALTCIGAHAFESCFCITDITFPEHLTEIGESAFCNADLRNIELPDSVQTLGKSAFAQNDFLKSVKLPVHLETIGDTCFADCPKLSDITIPDSVRSIGEDILLRDTAWYMKQTEPYVIFGDGFLYCWLDESTDIVIPETVRKIGQHAFYTQNYEYDSLRDTYNVYHVPRTDIRTITLPESMTEIPQYFCRGMTGLEQITLGSKIKQIPDAAFESCSALQSVTLPDGLESIGTEAFANCKKLAEIHIPDTVQTVEKNAFRNTLWLKNAGDFAIVGDGLLYQYQGKNYVVTVPDGVKTICTDAFRISDPVSVTLPSSVRQLCTDSFSSSSLVNVTLNNGLTEIPAGVFSGAASLSEITIPESVTKIDQDAFNQYSRLTVIGETASAAEQFAKQNGFPFIQQTAVSDGQDMTLHTETDCWSFSNNYTTFGGNYYISDEDRALLEQYELTPDAEWGGSCYGMCVTVILAKSGIISADCIQKGAASLSEIPPEPQVQSMINFYQATTGNNVKRLNNPRESDLQRIYRAIRTAEQIPHGEMPFLVCFGAEKHEGHAAVAYGTEEGEWSYNGKTWTHRILLYDPNRSKLYDERCLYYDPETLEICIPHYHFTCETDADGYAPVFIICTEPEQLNSYKYPFTERFSSTDGDVNADGKVNADDVILLQKWLLAMPDTQLSAQQSADLDRNGKLNAADLAQLKQIILAQ